MLIDTTKKSNPILNEDSERIKPSKKTKVSKSFTFDPDFWEKVEEFRFKHRFPSATALVTKALEEYTEKLQSKNK